MADRRTGKDAQEAFGRLADALGKPHDGPMRQGLWVLSYMGGAGYVISEYVNDTGGITYPLGDTRRPSREFCAYVYFALRSLELAPQIRATRRITNIFQGRRRSDVRSDAPKVVADVVDALMAEGLMV